MRSMIPAVRMRPRSIDEMNRQLALGCPHEGNIDIMRTGDTHNRVGEESRENRSGEIAGCRIGIAVIDQIRGLSITPIISLAHAVIPDRIWRWGLS